MLNILLGHLAAMALVVGLVLLAFRARAS